MADNGQKASGGGILRTVLCVALAVPLVLVALHTLVRIVRRFYKFPIPEFLASLIDHPLRRKMQPPDGTAIRHGLEPGMTVLEVGPGTGTYTMGAARQVGPEGKVVTIDIEPKMIKRVERRAEAEGIDNVQARVADVYDLPFEDGAFDAAYMIAVIGEIPDPERAMVELYRVLKPGGTLACSEVIVDPDYPLVRTLEAWAAPAGFKLQQKMGNWFYYTLIFVR